jgi:CheY-like chemotaxis protein
MAQRGVRKMPASPAQSIVAAVNSADLKRTLGGAVNGIGQVSKAQDTQFQIPALAPKLPDLDKMLDEVGDDREQVEANDRVLLIVENDLTFARFLLAAAREEGFKGIVTSLGAAALALAHDHKPAAITLDIYLPDMDGWRVLERLKNDIQTRHISVCVISTDESRTRALNG